MLGEEGCGSGWEMGGVGGWTRGSELLTESENMGQEARKERMSFAPEE